MRFLLRLLLISEFILVLYGEKERLRGLKIQYVWIRKILSGEKTRTCLLLFSNVRECFVKDCALFLADYKKFYIIS
jgi:hypothetical protein